MIKFFITVIAIVISVSASAETRTVYCQVDNDGEKVNVPVIILEGGAAAKIKPTKFQDVDYAVTWQQGQEGESKPQSILQMMFGGYTSTMYDFTLDGHVGPINVIEGKARFQCFVDDKE